MTRQIALIGILLLGAAVMPAQTVISAPFVPTDVELKAYLGLTDSQAQTLRDIQQSRMEAEQAIYQQMNQKQQALNGLLESGSRDAVAIGQLMIDIAALRKQLPLKDPYQQNALAVLSPDQKAKLPNLSAVLVQQTIAWQAVNWNLIDAPPSRILPVDANVNTISAEPARILPAIAGRK